MLTDRSRIISFQTCPRQRFLAYHVNGTGLQRKAKSLPLSFGGAFHTGTQALLSHPDHPYERDGYLIERAVSEAHLELQDAFDEHAISFDSEIPDDAQKALDYGKEEQMALAEGLLRAWWIYEGESFLEGFEVLEVEREGRAELANWPEAHPIHNWVAANGPMQCTACGKLWEPGHSADPCPLRKDSLNLMFRPDALVRDRMSGDHYIISWKTCATFGKRNTDQARHDQQSISEAWGIMQERGIRVEGILYKFVIKGRRNKDDYTGLYIQDSPLIYGWKKLGQSEEETEWAWKYQWQTEEMNQKTGKLVTTKLGKGWKKVPIWSDYPGGVRQWIDDLSRNQIAPRHIDALAQVFPQALPVERRADEVEHWKTQIIAQERSVNDRLNILSGVWPDAEMLDVAFPQHTHSCHSYSGCPFLDICWNGAKAEVGDLYQIREANHPEKVNGDE